MILYRMSIFSSYHLRCRFVEIDLKECFLGINFKLDMIAILLSVLILKET